MRGYYEESEEVKARRQLQAAARKYAGEYLAGPHIDSGAAERLEEAALAFAKAVTPVKKPVKKKRAA